MTLPHDMTMRCLEGARATIRDQVEYDRAHGRDDYSGLTRRERRYSTDEEGSPRRRVLVILPGENRRIPNLS